MYTAYFLYHYFMTESKAHSYCANPHNPFLKILLGNLLSKSCHQLDLKINEVPLTLFTSYEG